MIRLTNASDKENIYIKPYHIVSVIGNAVKTTNDYYCVTESPQEVARKVLLYNTAKSDYVNGETNVKETARLALMMLAGLEDNE